MYCEQNCIKELQQNEIYVPKSIEVLILASLVRRLTLKNILLVLLVIVLILLTDMKVEDCRDISSLNFRIMSFERNNRSNLEKRQFQLKFILET